METEESAHLRQGSAPDFFNLGANAASPVLRLQATPTTFAPFSRLPTELRRAIWKEACNLRKLVDIQPTVLTELETQDRTSRMQIALAPADYRNGTNKFEYKTMSQAPAILHTSPEAREVGLESYSLEFGTQYIETFGRAQVD
jgi:hypothetical protein